LVFGPWSYVIGLWSLVLCHWSLVIGLMSFVIGEDGGDWGSSTSRLQSFCFVRSNDFSRYRVTWHQPSNAHVRPASSPHPGKRETRRLLPGMAIAIPGRATTEVVTTNKKQSNDFSRSVLFVVTTSVVTGLLGISQVTPMSGHASSPQPGKR
jgi:hypothetical protein